MSQPLRVLFVEDSEDDVSLFVHELTRGGFEPRVERVQTARAFRESLMNDEWDVVVSDYSMPGFNGLQALKIQTELAPEIPFILMSGTVGEAIAIDSIKAGASDYLMKDNLIRFVPAVNRALREAAERRVHRRAVVSLRESQAMLSLIYNSTSDYLILFSVLPDDSYRIASVNQTFLDFARGMLASNASPAIVGRRMEEVAESIFHCKPETTDLLREKCSLAKREKRPLAFETVFELPGRRMFVELTLIPVSSQEAGGEHLLWSCRDISGRKAAEERQRLLESQLQQAKKLEALGQLAGGIAHDFNNLLTGILGYGELVKSAVASNGTLQGQVDQILHAAYRAKDLVRQILAFSRREAASREPVYLEPIIREALDLIRASAPGTIRIETSFAPSLPPILGNASQLHQVLINLCTNAVQAMEEGGLLSVSAETSHVDAAFARNHPPLREGDHVRLSIGDTGPGIASTAMEHLFEPFFTTKLPGAGTGLGLAVVHGIVLGHEGTITVYSRPGEGSRFQVYLPSSDVLPDSATSITRKFPVGHNERILLVDDEVGIVTLAFTVLQRIGYHPVSFTNAMDALKAFSEDPSSYAAVITDLTMPKLNGVDLAKAIHDLRPEIPIILTSGYSGAIDEGRIARSGFCEVVGKPFAMRTLAEALHRALQGKGNTSAG